VAKHAGTYHKAVKFAVAGFLASTDLVVTVNPGHIGISGAGNINRLELGAVQQEPMLESVRADVAPHDLASDVDRSGLGVGSTGEVKGKESRWRNRGRNSRRASALSRRPAAQSRAREQQESLSCFRSGPLMVASYPQPA
jgi:hypothetical protein